MSCSNCGGWNVEDSGYCRACGHALPEVGFVTSEKQTNLDTSEDTCFRYCPYCGKPLTETSEDCWNCGRSLAEIQAVVDAEPSWLDPLEAPPRVSLYVDGFGQSVVAAAVRIEDAKGDWEEIVAHHGGIPLSTSKTLYCKAKGQTSTDLDIWLFQGRHPNATDDCLLAQYRIHGVSIRPGSYDGVVDVTVEIQINGVASVSARDCLRDEDLTMTKQQDARIPSWHSQALCHLPKKQQRVVRLIPLAVILV